VADERVIAIYHGKMSRNSIATARDPLLRNWKKHLFSQQCAVALVYPLQEEKQRHLTFRHRREGEGRFDGRVADALDVAGVKVSGRGVVFGLACSQNLLLKSIVARGAPALTL